MFFHTCTNGEDVGIKDDVIGVKSHFADQQIVGSSADFHFTVSICGLEESKLISPGVCVLEICAERSVLVEAAKLNFKNTIIITIIETETKILVMMMGNPVLRCSSIQIVNITCP